MENSFKFLTNFNPVAFANISGGINFPDINGIVQFYQLPEGIIVLADIEGLPKTDTNIFAFHIHEGEDCENNFQNSGGHFNPTNQTHPNHAGDMPPLFSNNGNAWLAFFTQRFNLNEIIGKTVIIHDQLDDFTSQPAGNSGTKIACGKILKIG